MASSAGIDRRVGWWAIGMIWILSFVCQLEDLTAYQDVPASRN